MTAAPSRWILLACLAIAGGLGTGYAGWLLHAPAPGRAPSAPSGVSAGASAPEPADAGLRLPAASGAHNPLATEPARRTTLSPELDLVGSVDYDGEHYAIVGPLAAGRIVAVHARPGDPVRAGQVLAELESPDVGQAAAAWLSASARATVSRANLRRENELAAQRISSSREREVAEAQAGADQAELRSAEQRLLAMGLRPGEVAGLAAGGRGNVRRGGRVALRSPIAGVVVKRLISLGQAVEASTDTFHVADLDRMWVHLDLYERDLRHVRPGQAAVVRTDAWPGETFPCRVAWIEERIDPATRTARARVELRNRDRKLRPGQFVTAHLEAHGEGLEVLAVPRRAVLSIDGKSIVFVASPDGRSERRVVQTGRIGGALLEVRSGLAEGEQVVTDGAFLLKSESQR